MAKHMARLIIVLFIWGCILICGGLAEAENDTRSVPSIDAVIVMDQSNSMSGGSNMNTINDPNGNRFDAALMLIGMCDMNGSRVAFLPFANRILLEDYREYAFNDFVPMQDENLRDKQWKGIEALRKARTYPGTDLGIALASAINVLLDRTDKTNNPMIILLTDGDNDVVYKGELKQSYEWSDSQDRFIKKNYAKYFDSDADALMQQATLVAKNKGIPICTIQLLDNENSAALENKLSGIAAKTKGLYKKIKPENAYELPLVFGDVFASKIGSHLLRDLKPIKDQGNHFHVDLPILNNSLIEANIYIPLNGIENVKLYDPDTNDLTGGADDVIWSESPGRFWLYKIKEPKILGSWRLEFDLPNNANSAADVSVSMLYNYNIALKTQLGSGLSLMREAGQGITIDKGETLHVSSQFYGLDGNPSQDTALYKVWPPDASGEDWKTIKASYQLLDDKNVLFSGELVNQGDGFTADIDLAHAYVDSNGKNMLNQGDYMLKITADGAGLHREEILQVTLLNNIPRAASGSDKRQLSTTMRVDDPSKPKTQDTQTLEFNLNELIVDPDNDPLLYDLKPTGNAAEILPLTLNKSSGIISGQTIKDESTGLFNYGDAEYTLTVKDADPLAEPIDWILIIQVESEASKFLDNSKCVTTYTNIDANGSTIKGTDIVFTMHLEDKAGAPDITGKIMQYTGQVAICSASNNSDVLQKIDMVLNDQKTALTATYTTPYKSKELQAKFTYQYSSYDKKQASDTIEFEVNNTPPQVNNSILNVFPVEITYDPLPGFLASLEQSTLPETLVLQLDKLFYDDDNEPLTYGEPVFTSESYDNVTLMQTERQGMVQKFIPVGSGKLSITITAKDGDEVEAKAIINANIINITKKWLLIGIVVLALLITLIIIIIIIHQIRKPRFPDEGLIVTKENASLYDSYTSELRPRKNAEPLSNHVNEAIAERNGIPVDSLDKIWIKPKRGANGAILIKCKKPLSGCLARLDEKDTEIGRKYTPWGMDREIIIESRETRNYLRIQLSRNQDVYSRAGSISFGGDVFGSFGKSDDVFDNFNSEPDKGSKCNKNGYRETDF